MKTAFIILAITIAVFSPLADVINHLIKVRKYKAHRREGKQRSN